MLGCGRGFAVERTIAGGRNIPTEGPRHRIAPHRVEAVFHGEGREGTTDAAEEGFGGRLLEQKSSLAIEDGFGEAAGLMADRQRSEFLGIHLAQSARLEPRRH